MMHKDKLALLVRLLKKMGWTVRRNDHLAECGVRGCTKKKLIEVAGWVYDDPSDILYFVIEAICFFVKHGRWPKM